MENRNPGEIGGETTPVAGVAGMFMNRGIHGAFPKEMSPLYEQKKS